MYVEVTSTFQRRSICIFNCYSTLIRRQKCNVETTSILRRRSDVDYYTSEQRRSLNVDSVCVFNHFSTSIRRHALTLFRRRFAGWDRSRFIVNMWFKFFSLPLQVFRPYFVVFLALGMFYFCEIPCKHLQNKNFPPSCCFHFANHGLLRIVHG